MALPNLPIPVAPRANAGGVGDTAPTGVKQRPTLDYNRARRG